jgi:hypothetical protein
LVVKSVKPPAPKQGIARYKSSGVSVTKNKETTPIVINNVQTFKDIIDNFIPKFPRYRLEIYYGNAIIQYSQSVEKIVF